VRESAGKTEVNSEFDGLWVGIVIISGFFGSFLRPRVVHSKVELMANPKNNVAMAFLFMRHTLSFGEAPCLMYLVVGWANFYVKAIEKEEIGGVGSDPP
jgi:hypothetical protein